MLALGEDRALVATYLVDRPAGALGHLLGGGAGTDQGLDVAGAKARVGLDLLLAEPGPVVADGRAQRLVDAHTEPAAVRIGQQQVLAVLVHADQSQVLHGHLPGRPTAQTLPSPPASAKQATPHR